MTPGIPHIRAFLAVARHGSFTRAANELHVSQPALTVQIKQLEEALGARLFDRDKHRVQITQMGRSLTVPFEKILVDLDAIMHFSRELTSHQRGVVSMSVLPSVAASLLPDVLKAFSSKYPGIIVHVYDVVGERIIKQVKDGEVDFGIGWEVGPDKDLAVREFLTDRMCAFFPSGHPLEGKWPLALADLTAYPLILTAAGTSVRILVDRAIEQAGLAYRLSCEAHYMSTIAGMIRSGLGISILPESAVNVVNCEGLVVAPLQDDNLTRRIGVIRLANRSLSPAAEIFIGMLLTVAGEGKA